MFSWGVVGQLDHVQGVVVGGLVVCFGRGIAFCAG